MSLATFGLRFLQLVDLIPPALEAFEKVKLLLVNKLSSVISPPSDDDEIDKQLLAAIHKAYRKKFADLDRMIQLLESKVKAKESEIQRLNKKLDGAGRAFFSTSLKKPKQPGTYDFKDVQFYAWAVIRIAAKLCQRAFDKILAYLASYNDQQVDILVNDETYLGNLANEYHFGDHTYAVGLNLPTRKRTNTN